jgi:ABC-type Fe3+/spermidine/putrescine transport system ATPase subunit
VRAVVNGAAGPAAGSAITVAIRPEKINLSLSQPNVGHNMVHGKMSAAAYLGDRSHFYVSIAGRDAPVAVASQNVDKSSDLSKANQPVWLSWRDDSIVLLTR